MPYVTSWERIAKEEGLEEGEIADKQKVLIRQLERKFGLSAEEKSRIEEERDRDKLDAALDAIVFAASKDEVLEKL